MKRLAVIAAFVPCLLSAQEETAEATDDTNVVTFETMHVEEDMPANDTPSAGFPTVATTLRYNPTVDVQSRGFAETQCDVVIRGGIFENTGFKVGAVTLMDPQTGHYSSEIPIDPLMISSPEVLTGADNALEGFNSSVGTVAYTWMPIQNTGTIEVGAGTDSLFFSRFIAGYKTGDDYFLGRALGVQVASAYSRGDGTVESGDHRFQRYGIRLQLAGQGGQTDLYAGYQRKFYNWPGMYTGNSAYDEGEKYEVALLMLNHTQTYGNDSTWSFGAYTRQLLDDYELKRSIPGYYRPYRHDTKVSGAAAEGTHNFNNDWKLDWHAEYAADHIQSTDLTYANFMSRSYYKASAELGRTVRLGEDTLLLQAGASYDGTNRDDDEYSPIARATYNSRFKGGQLSTYAEFSRATQVAGYTAIGSKPGQASFAGDADLPRERADNYEIGTSWTKNRFKTGASIFYRTHIDLTDWIYDSTQATTFRTAAAMDLDVKGVETYASWDANDTLSFTLGYAWLEADPDYGTANVDASFYAMNYPIHHATSSVAWKIVENLELRVDAEARKQEKNARRTSDNDAFIMSTSLSWSPDFVDGMTIALLADNLTDCDYEDFPGSPAEGRQVAMRVSYVW